MLPVSVGGSAERRLNLAAGAQALPATDAKAARTALSAKTPRPKRLALVDASLDQQIVLFKLDHGEDLH
jgi:hypothetical protein